MSEGIFVVTKDLVLSADGCNESVIFRFESSLELVQGNGSSLLNSGKSVGSSGDNGSGNLGNFLGECLSSLTDLTEPFSETLVVQLHVGDDHLCNILRKTSVDGVLNHSWQIDAGNQLLGQGVSLNQKNGDLLLDGLDSFRQAQFAAFVRC